MSINLRIKCRIHAKQFTMALEMKILQVFEQRHLFLSPFELSFIKNCLREQREKI